MPSHNHTTSIDGGHVIPGNQGNTYPYGGPGTYASTIFSMNNAGSDQEHENRPPYYALCYIIKHTATAGSGGGISGITVEDEGSALSTTATTLNFVGAGVTASGTGATKTITINGGGSGGGGSSLWSSGIGSDIYYNSGDVGIGTTNPTAVLDVDGYTELDDVNISGVVTSTSFVKSGGTNLQYLMVMVLLALSVVSARVMVMVLLLMQTLMALYPHQLQQEHKEDSLLLPKLRTLMEDILLLLRQHNLMQIISFRQQVAQIPLL